MFFHLRVFLHSLFFFLALELVLRESVSGFLVDLLFGSFPYLLLLILLYAVFIGASALKIGKSWSMLPAPLMLVFSSMGLIALIDSSTKKFFFMTLAWAAYYFCLLGLQRLRAYRKDQTARGMVAASVAIAVFLFYSCSYGIYLNFAIPLGILMVFFLAVTTLLSYQYFQLVQDDRKKALLYSLVIGMGMTEISWMINFWPFGYLTTGVTMLIFYYVLWDLAHSYFLETFSKRRAVSNMVLFGILATVVLTSSRWIPVI